MREGEKAGLATIPEVTRRAALVGIGVGGVELVKWYLSGWAFRSWEVETQPEQDELNRLQEVGLDEFVDFYVGARRLFGKYGLDELVERDRESSIFPELWAYAELRQVALGMVEANGVEVSRLRDGWGEKRDMLVEDARQKAAGLTFDMSETRESDETIRGMVEHFAEVLPLTLMGITGKVTVKNAGGKAGGSTLEVASPIINGINNAAVTWWHETTHLIEGQGTLALINPYIRRKDWINYLEGYTEALEQLVDYWLAIEDEDEALEFKTINFSFGSTPQEKIGALSRARLMELNFYGPEAIGLPEIDESNVHERYSRLLHRLGQAWVKNLQGEALNAREKGMMRVAFRDKKNFADLMQELLFNFHHHLVGPPQKRGGDMPWGWENREEGLLETKNEDIFRRRLGLMSTVLSADSSWAEVNQALGLERLFDETEKNRLLSQYGARHLGEFEYWQGKKCRIYHLPQNPFMADRELLLVNFEGKVNGDYLGNQIQMNADDLLLSIPREVFNESTVGECSWELVDSGRGVFSLQIGPRRRVEVSMQANIYTYYETDDPEVKVAWVYGQPIEEKGGSVVVRADYLTSGDWEGQESFSGLAQCVWFGKDLVWVFPLTQVEEGETAGDMLVFNVAGTQMALRQVNGGDEGFVTVFGGAFFTDQGDLRPGFDFYRLNDSYSNGIKSFLMSSDHQQFWAELESGSNETTVKWEVRVVDNVPGGQKLLQYFLVVTGRDSEADLETTYRIPIYPVG